MPVIPSATRAESRLSIAASAATASAAENSALVAAVSSTGTRGVGTLPGSGPIVMTSQSRTSTTTVATTIAMIDAGMALRILGRAIISTVTSATSASAGSAARQSAVAIAVSATRAVFSPSGFGMSRASGTCCRKMIVAIPIVKPSTTGQGMKVTARPSPNRPIAMTSPPAMMATGITASAP